MKGCLVKARQTIDFKVLKSSEILGLNFRKARFPFLLMLPCGLASILKHRVVCCVLIEFLKIELLCCAERVTLKVL